jgi:hypothetical protein
VFFFWLPSYFCSKWERFPPNINQRGLGSQKKKHCSEGTSRLLLGEEQRVLFPSAPLLSLRYGRSIWSRVTAEAINTIYVIVFLPKFLSRLPRVLFLFCYPLTSVWLSLEYYAGAELACRRLGLQEAAFPVTWRIASGPLNQRTRRASARVKACVNNRVRTRTR